MSGSDKLSETTESEGSMPVTSVSYPDDLADITDIPKGTVLREWYDEGARVIVVRSNASMNVYMGVPLEHPLAGFDYDNLPVNCHGGLTYAAKGGDYLPGGYFWYGYDYAHSGDYAWYDHSTPSFMANDKKWTLGEIVKDAWEPVYDFKKLMRIAEGVLKSREG